MWIFFCFHQLGNHDGKTGRKEREMEKEGDGVGEKQGRSKESVNKLSFHISLMSTWQCFEWFAAVSSGTPEAFFKNTKYDKTEAQGTNWFSKVICLGKGWRKETFATMKILRVGLF
jgi:hypothetical protein